MFLEFIAGGEAIRSGPPPSVGARRTAGKAPALGQLFFTQMLIKQILTTLRCRRVENTRRSFLAFSSGAAV